MPPMEAVWIANGYDCKFRSANSNCHFSQLRTLNGIADCASEFHDSAHRWRSRAAIDEHEYRLHTRRCDDRACVMSISAAILSKPTTSGVRGPMRFEWPDD